MSYILGVHYFTGPTVSMIADGRMRSFAGKWLHEHSVVARLRPGRPYGSLWDFCLQHPGSRVCLHRTYALGDILMLVPVCGLLKRHLEIRGPIKVAVGGRYIRDLKRVESPAVEFVRSRGGQRDYQADVHLELNSALEADHRGGEASNRHRIILYARAIGVPEELLRSGGRLHETPPHSRVDTHE